MRRPKPHHSTTRLTALPLCVGRFDLCFPLYLRALLLALLWLCVSSTRFAHNAPLFARPVAAQTVTSQMPPVLDDSSDELTVEADPLPTNTNLPRKSPLRVATPNSNVVSNAGATTRIAVASRATSRPFGRTFVVMLGGVSWAQWAALGASDSAATPAFRRVLEEGALAAARLPAVTWPASFSFDARAMPDIAARAVSNAVSSPMLRVAATLSAGDRSISKNAPDPLTALTLSARESLPTD